MSNRISKHFRSIAGVAAFAAMGGIGVVGAALMVPSSAYAAGGGDCAEDECNRTCGLFSCSETCIQNIGEETYCDVVGYNDCKTKGCAPE